MAARFIIYGPKSKFYFDFNEKRLFFYFICIFIHLHIDKIAHKIIFQTTQQQYSKGLRRGIFLGNRNSQLKVKRNGLYALQKELIHNAFSFLFEKYLPNFKYNFLPNFGITPLCLQRRKGGNHFKGTKR